MSALACGRLLPLWLIRCSEQRYCTASGKNRPDSAVAVVPGLWFRTTVVECEAEGPTLISRTASHVLTQLMGSWHTTPGRTLRVMLDVGESKRQPYRIGSFRHGVVTSFSAKNPPG